MRFRLGLLGMCLLAGCETTPSESTQAALDVGEARYKKLVADQSAKLDVDMQTAFDCSLFSAALASATGPNSHLGDEAMPFMDSALDDVTAHLVSNAVEDIYTGRVRTLMDEGVPLPGDLETLQTRGDMEAISRYRDSRGDFLEENNISFERAFNECRQRVVNNMTQDEIKTLASTAIYGVAN